MNDSQSYRKHWSEIVEAFKIVIKYILPLMSGIVLCAGVVRLRTYYYEFGIRINSYIDFDEYISFAVVDLSRYFVYILYALSFFMMAYVFRFLLFLVSIFFKKGAKIENEIERFKVKNFTPNNLDVRYKLSIGLLLLSLILPASVYYFLYDINPIFEKLNIRLVILYSLMGCMFSFTYMFFDQIKIRIYLIFPLITLLYFLNLMFSIVDDAKNIKKGFHLPYVSVFVMNSNNMILTSSENIKFIGKTRNFIFFDVHNDTIDFHYLAIPLENKKIEFISKGN